MFFVSVLQTFQPHFIMHFYCVCSVVHHLNRVFCLGGGGQSFCCVDLLIVVFSLLLFWGCFMIIVVLSCNS